MLPQMQHFTNRAGTEVQGLSMSRKKLAGLCAFGISTQPAALLPANNRQLHVTQSCMTALLVHM
jgi:hypothetical protein